MITLAALLVRRRVLALRRSKPRPMPTPRAPRAQVVAATREWTGINDELTRAIRAVLAVEGLGPRTDDDEESAFPLFPGPRAQHLGDQVAEAVARVLAARKAPMLSVLEGIGARVAMHAAEEFGRQVKAAMGIDLSAEPGVGRWREEYRRANTDLIVSLAEDRVARVREILAAAGSSTRVEDLAREIQDETGAASSRASLIARDQTLKLNGQVTKERHLAAGVSEYIWSTSKDERVRPFHVALEGTRHAYSDPPVVDKLGRRCNPGEDYQCRCVALPVLPDL